MKKAEILKVCIDELSKDDPDIMKVQVLLEGIVPLPDRFSKTWWEKYK